MTLLALLLTAALPTVASADDVKAQLGAHVQVQGTLERVALADGLGTALVLDDGTAIYVTYGAPPAGWAPLLGRFVHVEGELKPSLTDDGPSLLAAHLRVPGRPTAVRRDLASKVGHAVRLVGVAQPGPSGAVLQLERGAVGLEGLARWPAELAGRRVVAWGAVVRKQNQVVLAQAGWALVLEEKR